MIGMILTTLLSTATPGAAVTAASATATAEAPAQEKICRRRVVSSADNGVIKKVQKVCKTPEEWDRARSPRN